MKKLLAAILAIALCVSLAACGGGSPDPEPIAPEPAPAAAPEAKPAPVIEEDDEEESEPEEAVPDGKVVIDMIGVKLSAELPSDEWSYDEKAGTATTAYVSFYNLPPMDDYPSYESRIHIRILKYDSNNSLEKMSGFYTGPDYTSIGARAIGGIEMEGVNYFSEGIMGSKGEDWNTFFANVDDVCHVEVNITSDIDMDSGGWASLIKSLRFGF